MKHYADRVNLHARIYAMRGRLLAMRDYAAMVREQNDIVSKPSDNRQWVEARENLFREQIAPVIALAEAYDKYASIFLAYLRQYEMNNARLLWAQAAGRETSGEWYDIGPYASLDKSLLDKNLSLDEAGSLLAGTYLKDDFKPASGYLRMDVNLDISAARNIYNASLSISGQAGGELREMILKRMAILTVIWSYRLRVYYHQSEDNIRLYFMKLNNLFNMNPESQIRAVEEDVTRQIEKLRKSGGQEPSAIDIERYLEQNFYAWLSAMFHRDFHSVYCVVSYLWLLFYQIKNLFRIMDGRRFGMSADAILNDMICSQ
jgi:vacuolar-type H+-ATPase subunit C/Vma6